LKRFGCKDTKSFGIASGFAGKYDERRVKHASQSVRHLVSCQEDLLVSLYS